MADRYWIPGKSTAGGATHQRGFTLVELMIVIALISLVTGLIYPAFSSYSRICTGQEVAAQAQGDVRSALNFIERDIRRAGYDPRGGAAGAGIVDITPGTFRFTADSNKDGDTGDTDEDITYSLAAGTLTRTDNNLPPAETLIDNLTGCTFAYLEADGDATVVLADIRSIEITLQVTEMAGRYRESGSAQMGVRRTLSTRIRARNL